MQIADIKPKEYSDPVKRARQWRAIIHATLGLMSNKNLFDRDQQKSGWSDCAECQHIFDSLCDVAAFMDITPEQINDAVKELK